MKIFNQIRYVIIAIMVVGCFANFAQNEYGLTILYFSEFLIALTFLIESVLYFRANISTSKTKAIYLFSEHFWLGGLFIGFSLWAWGPSPYARLTIFASIFFLTIQYLLFAIRTLIKEPKNGVLLSLLVFLFIILSILVVVSLSWKINHWPGSSILTTCAFYSSLFFILIVIIKRKYRHNGEKITLKNRVMEIPGKMPFVFCYSSVWIIYISLTIFHVMPGFYTLSSPPEGEKLKQNSLNSRADVFWNNYDNFNENRRKAQEK